MTIRQLATRSPRSTGSATRRTPMWPASSGVSGRTRAVAFQRRRNNGIEATTMKLSSDSTFHFNLLRWLGTAPYHGVDVAEVLDVADRITPGDFESWHREFLALAQQVAAEGARSDRASSITVRDRAFRAASYYRAADFFLHGTPDDPRIDGTWASATALFNQAIAHLAPAAERLTIQ